MKGSFLFLLCLISFSALSQTISSDTLNVVVQTKFGELTFRKICQENKFEFQQTKDPIFDKDVELEAQQKHILKDTLEVQFSIDKKGKIVSFNITKQSSLGKLNTFISDIFNDAIIKMRNQTYSLNCNNMQSVHTMPLIYERQRSK
jgi:hypothetical protein